MPHLNHVAIGLRIIEIAAVRIRGHNPSTLFQSSRCDLWRLALSLRRPSNTWNGSFLVETRETVEPVSEGSPAFVNEIAPDSQSRKNQEDFAQFHVFTQIRHLTPLSSCQTI